MKLGTRIFLCYVITFVVCFTYPVKWTLDTLRTRYLEAVEDSLVDQANILASLVGARMVTGKFSADELGAVFTETYHRELSATIYSITKRRVDSFLYVTDGAGRVVFDSTGNGHVGEDYSRWRDVHLTLQGQYGARTTKSLQNLPETSVLHVAAPIIADGQIVGVLTVVKPTTMINDLLDSAKPQLLKVFVIFALLAFLVSFLVSQWMTRPIKKLTRYAEDIRHGRRVSFPALDNSEIGEMGKSFEKMQEALEGKRYVEGYVQTLTHEIKSPLSAIRGAAELLEEKMPAERQARFLANIRNEAGRIQNLVDRMLELSALENVKSLARREPVFLDFLVQSVVNSQEAMLAKKGLLLDCASFPDVVVEGEPFLLQQALANLVQNGIDFSPRGGRIEVQGQIFEDEVRVTICDQGPGIPDYAQAKLFDRFFSLQRPDTGLKSTGLGLNFVREVALLHNGTISLSNRQEGGACATLTLPRWRSEKTND